MEKEIKLQNEGNDRDERIESRRKRIEERNISKNDEARKKKTNAVEVKHMTLGQQQIAASLNQLDRRKLAGIEQVTDIRVETDKAENLRRTKEEEARSNRLKRLQEEAFISAKRNAAVEMRWSELSEYNMPQDLYNEINIQKSSCDTIMASKDDLIHELKHQLKLKDEEYVQALKKESEDIETLLQRMVDQQKELKEEYEMELEQIEDVFLKERDDLLGNNKKEIDALFEKRRSNEMAYMDAKQARDERYRKEIEELRIKDAEDYNKLKIKLETDIQTLEQQLEEMRATYQLNTEKLEYNYRVLTERDMENSGTLSQQKKRLSRLKDTLSSLMQKYAQTDARDRHQNEELTEEYRRATKQYTDLQSKYRHFEVADNKRFNEVWNMHEKEVAEMIEKVLKADRIIHEQQLGLKWIPPQQQLIKSSRGQHLNNELEEKEDKKENKYLNHHINDEEDNKDDKTQSKLSSKKLKLMLSMLSSEAGFLVDPSVKEAIDSLDDQEAELIRADSILRSLGIESETDMEKLLSYFFEKTTEDHDHHLQDIVEPSQVEENTCLIHEIGLKIKPDDVIRVVKQFVEENNEVKRQENSVQFIERASSVSEQETKETLKAKIQNEERDFWIRASTVIPEKTLNVWTYLEKGLTKYNKILQSRNELVQEVTTLQNQNNELKSLLRQYLGSQVNDELLVPPTQTIVVKGKNQKD